MATVLYQIGGASPEKLLTMEEYDRELFFCVDTDTEVEP